MKQFTITRYLPLAICSALFLGVAQTASAQHSANTNAYGRAEIVAAITISKNHDLLFGQIVSDTVGGTVIVTSAGDRTSSHNVLLTQSGSTYSTVHQASFAVTGSAGFSYMISLPVSAITLTSGSGDGAPTMTLDTFTSDGTAGLKTLDGVTGLDTLNVGGTLHVGANQAAGAYSGTFSVTIAYQ